MKFHDYHLKGYEVNDYGSAITLHLSFDYEGENRDESHITFNEVVAYHFIHTGGAIITDIEEVSLDVLLKETITDLSKWSKMHGGIALWDDDASIYQSNLEREGYKSWLITSAIGFEGFVIGRKVE